MPLLLALSVQTAPSLETPGIILTRSGDTVFLAPTKSIGRDGAIRGAVLVEIYPAALEEWETVRRDSIVQMDCAASRIRVLAAQAFDGRDLKRGSPQPGPGEWARLNPADFPRAILFSMTCSDADLGGISYANLADEIPRLRNGLR
ncbi:hypothetical protein [Brevundimonas sp.]|uniref:hypothetical protein n=1 Tax=Brevundimonas sp. TaxID=1871086 RepID=UPI002D2FA48D|nr:hypothetical protein [Brevundimonas sp.]HYC68662.1 hypothetical protein [Brevundimonas sp.]